MKVHFLVVDTFYILPKYLYLCATFYSIRSQKIVPYYLCFEVCKKGMLYEWNMQEDTAEASILASPLRYN
jgi:hypothetical protein